jgi:hypothetical protein
VAVVVVIVTQQARRQQMEPLIRRKPEGNLDSAEEHSKNDNSPLRTPTRVTTDPIEKA